MVKIFQIKNKLPDWNITLFPNCTPISYKIDTGAQRNVILVKSLENISPKPDLQSVNVKLSVYNGFKIPVVGKSSLNVAHKNSSFKVSFLVVESDSAPVLGLKTSENLLLVKRICRIETSNDTPFPKFHDCSGEIGILNVPHHIEVTKPLVTPVGKVPHVDKPKLEKRTQMNDWFIHY